MGLSTNVDQTETPTPLKCPIQLTHHKMFYPISEREDMMVSKALMMEPIQKTILS